MGNIIRLSVHSRNFGSHMSVRLFIHPSAPEGYQCEMSWEPLQPVFNLIIDIRIMV